MDIDDELRRLRALKAAIEEMRQVLGSLELACQGVVSASTAVMMPSIETDAGMVADTIDGLHLKLFQWEMSVTAMIGYLES